jgi:hypothetical protein
MIQRDGLFILLGIIGGLLVTGILIGAVDVAGNILLR